MPTKPTSIADATQQIEGLLINAATNLGNYLNEPSKFQLETLQFVHDSVLDAHLLSIWISDHLNDGK